MDQSNREDGHLASANRWAGRRAGRVRTAALGGFAALAIAVGCGGGESGVGNSKLPEGTRSQVIEHEACDESGNKVDVQDANGDGKPDIKRVYKGGHEVCRISDLNHDGKPDMFEYYDASGALRRREADYDDNGIVNAIETFENGRLVRRELDTTNQGRLDTWDFFDGATGVRVKRERDANGDGRIDQWWSYEGDKVTIANDHNGDGQPDPETTFVLGGVTEATGTGVGAGVDAGSGDAGLDAASAAFPITDAGTPAVTMPSLNPAEPAPSLAVSDAGVVGKPQRGGAKR